MNRPAPLFFRDPRRTRILIVEDNEDLAFGLRRTLKDEGYAVEVASDGLRGSQRARDDKPDLVILDLMLPGMDGYRTLESIRGAGLQMPVSGKQSANYGTAGSLRPR